LSNHIGPDPAPNFPPLTTVPPVKFSWRQTTLAAWSFQKSSQIVPHLFGPLTKTSTLPEYWSFPLTNRNFVGSEMIYKISGLGLRSLAPLSTIFMCKISKIEMYTSIAKELLLQ
jgi:hypothetical protein